MLYRDKPVKLYTFYVTVGLHMSHIVENSLPKEPASADVMQYRCAIYCKLMALTAGSAKNIPYAAHIACSAMPENGNLSYASSAILGATIPLSGVSAGKVPRKNYRPY